MKVTTEYLPEHKMAINILLDEQQVKKELDKVARRFSQKHNIPGFRKGKAPRFIVERYFGADTLLQEAIPHLVSKSYNEAMIEHNIVPIADPETDVQYTDDGVLFQALVPLAPQVVLPDYHNIHVPLDVETIDEDVVDTALEQLREKHVILKELEEPRPAQDGDALTITIQEIYADNKPVEETDDNSHEKEETIALIKERIRPEMYDALLHTNVDDVVTVTLPANKTEDTPDGSLASQDITYTIQIVAIQERIVNDLEELPELEEFDGTFEAFCDHVRQELLAKALQKAMNTVVNTFVEQIINQSEFHAADVSVNYMAQQLIADYEKQLQPYGINIDQMFASVLQGKNNDERYDTLLEYFRPEAQKQIRQQYVFREIVEQEGITVSQDEVDQTVATLMTKYPEEEQEDIHAMLLSPEYQESIKEQLFQEKFFQRMFTLATDGVAQNNDDEQAIDGMEDDDVEDDDVEPRDTNDANDMPDANEAHRIVDEANNANEADNTSSSLSMA